MVSFLIYDIGFLVLFSLFVFIYLYKRRKNLERQSLLFLPVFLYRSQFGIKTINYISDKYSRLLHGLKYLIIAIGYLLMVMILYMFGSSFITYLINFREITQAIPAPPIAPLIPYFPSLFGLQSFFPPLYFTYFIVALAIVAIFHEFAHGIYMRLFKVKIKSTGFAFFGPFLGAFVEQDDKSFKKKKIKEQLSVLSAGVFANLVLAILFFVLLVGFFNLSFVPSGYMFNSYARVAVPVDMISGYGNFSNDNVNLTEVYVGNQTFYLPDDYDLNRFENSKLAVVYSDNPAVKSGLKGTIVSVNGNQIKNGDDFSEFMNTSKPGQEIVIKTRIENQTQEYKIELDEHPNNDSKGYLGVGFQQGERKGIIGFIFGLIEYKDASTDYQPAWDGNFVVFIYNLLWWVAVINILVALFNMLPLGILDGGRFFYLSVLAVTKSEKVSKFAYKLASIILLFAVFMMMVYWFFGIIS